MENNPQKPQEKAMTVEQSIIKNIGKAEYNKKQFRIEFVNPNINLAYHSLGWCKVCTLSELNQFITDAINEKIATKSLRARVEELEAENATIQSAYERIFDLCDKQLTELATLKQKADKWDAINKQPDSNAVLVTLFNIRKNELDNHRDVS